MVKGGGTPLVLPLTICDLSAISTIGFMIRSGGSAIISKTLGEGRNEDAQKYFSLMIYFIIRVSTVIAALGAMFIRPIAGEDGVVAYGAIMYIFTIFTGVFFGYSIGSSPIVGYHYGAGNTIELKNMFKKGLTLLMTLGAEMLIIAEVLNVPLIGIFASYDANQLHMASRGFCIYAVAFLFMGINIWASGFFTALGNGAISAAISFIRAFLFQLVAIFLLPIFLKPDGVWLAIVVAEFVSIFMSAAFLYAYRKQYQYL